MKIAWIEKMKDLIERRRLKRLTDVEIISELEKMVKQEPEKIPELASTMIDYINQPENVVKALDTVTSILGEETQKQKKPEPVVSGVEESSKEKPEPVVSNLDKETLDEAIQKLPKKQTDEAISNPNIRGNLPISTLDRLIDTNSTKTLDNILKEMYERAGNVSDYTVIDILKKAQENEVLSLKATDTIRKTIAKQIASNYAKFENTINLKNFLTIYPISYGKDDLEGVNEEILDLVDLVDNEYPEIIKVLNKQYLNDKAIYEKNKHKDKKWLVEPKKPYPFTQSMKVDLKNRIEEIMQQKQVEEQGNDLEK